MKDELGGQIMKELVGLGAKTYSYLKEKNDKDKKNKRYKKMCHDIKTIYLEKKNFNAGYLKKIVKNKLIIKTQQKFKSEGIMF